MCGDRVKHTQRCVVFRLCGPSADLSAAAASDFCSFQLWSGAQREQPDERGLASCNSCAALCGDHGSLSCLCVTCMTRAHVKQQIYWLFCVWHKRLWENADAQSTVHQHYILATVNMLSAFQNTRCTTNAELVKSGRSPSTRHAHLVQRAALSSSDAHSDMASWATKSVQTGWIKKQPCWGLSGLGLIWELGHGGELGLAWAGGFVCLA